MYGLDYSIGTIEESDTTDARSRQFLFFIIVGCIVSVVVCADKETLSSQNRITFIVLNVNANP